MKTVILIDNNEIDNFINQKILKSFGATHILTFTSTTTALNHLKQTKDAPQLIVMDIFFPIMDGFEFLNEFGKLEIAKQPIDIFILSASINPVDIQMAKQHKNCLGFIEKPLTIHKLFPHLEPKTKHTLPVKDFAIDY